ncbi:MAG: methyl-accepting chemotaxis protein, partial [Gammaproteobacteria bacterium]|nr:methyl-accepting chemotaxis protein [Gammaproteobacteria bacterium]
DAAREIKTLIEDSVEKVRIGTQQVDNSGAALMSIVDGIKKVSDIVTEINNASQQQALGIGEVNTAVAHMDDRIQQNAAFVEQSSAATKRMKDQASVLNDVIAYFKLASSTTGISSTAGNKATGSHPLKLESHS